MNILITMLSCFAGTVLIIPFIIKMAKKLHIQDEADARKTHKEKVSALGGIGIWPVVMGICTIAGAVDYYLLSAVALLWVVSLIDDLYPLNPGLRLLVQLAVGMIVFDGGYQLAFDAAPYLEMLATVVFVVGLINAYNFIDGINGLAGSLALLGSFFLGGSLAYHGDLNNAFVAFALSASLLGFLKYNFGQKARIFMGDNGSAVIGLVLAMLAIRLGQTDASPSAFAPSAMAILAIPMADLARVVATRIRKGKSPLKAGRDHIHHLLVDNGIMVTQSSIVLLSWTVVLLVFSLFPAAWLLIGLGLLTGFGIIQLRIAKPAVALNN
jgi:UDP-GlcNAc:undecaprenyl-phosphate GlcNAc-1-phosphate transferase